MNELIELIYRFDHSALLFIQENLRFEPVTPVMKFASGYSCSASGEHV